MITSSGPKSLGLWLQCVLNTCWALGTGRWVLGAGCYPRLWGHTEDQLWFLSSKNSVDRVRKEHCSVRGRGKLSKQYPRLPCGELKISEHIEYQVNFKNEVRGTTNSYKRVNGGGGNHEVSVSEGQDQGRTPRSLGLERGVTPSPGGHSFPRGSLGSLGGNGAAAGREAGLGAGDVGRQDHAQASILLTAALSVLRLQILLAILRVPRPGSSAS